MKRPELKRAGIIVIVLFLSFCQNLKGQETGPHFLLPGISQTSLFNPAHINETDKLVLGVPLFSGIYGNWNANVPVNSFFFDGFSYSFSKLYNELAPQGKVDASARASVFYASLNHNDFTFSLSVSERFLSAGTFDRDIVKLIRDGTMAYYGTNEYFGQGDFQFQHFRELAFGISKRVWSGLDIGIRPKLLFGRIYFDARGVQLSVETDQERKQLLVKPEGSFKLAGPFTHNRNELYNFSSFKANIFPGDYFFQPRNMGFALDFGAVFRPNKSFEFSFSLLDAGLTTFKHNAFDVEFSRAARYSEYRLYQSHSPDENNYIEPREALKVFGDSVSYIIDVVDAASRSLILLPVKLNISGKYNFSETLTAGVNNQFSYFHERPRNLFSAFVQSRLSDKTTLSGGLSLYNFSAVWPGLGISHTSGKFQIFFSTNNISGIIQPAATKHLNLCLGINLLFDT